jgi:hypothetical protein
MPKKKKAEKAKTAKPKKVIAPKIVKPAKAKKPVGPKKETKLEKVIKLLTRAEGATIQRIMDETDWQPHTVRATISHTISKKMGLKVESEVGEDKIRRYKIVIKS